MQDILLFPVFEFGESLLSPPTINVRIFFQLICLEAFCIYCIVSASPFHIERQHFWLFLEVI